MTFTFGTLCSGIDAAALAFDGLGAEQLYAAEIDAFCCAVLGMRYGASAPWEMPASTSKIDWNRLRQFTGFGDSFPNFGDIYQIDTDQLPAVDVLVSGTPCQDFSDAGKKAGLNGLNGQLTIRFLDIVDELARTDRVRAVLWENVPRVLTASGNPFGTILGRLCGSDAPIHHPWFGGKYPRAGLAVGPQGAAAWRVLDAQYFGLAQRRERLFVVAGVGPRAVDPVAVLFERRVLQAPHPRRDEGEEGHAADLLEGCWPPVAYSLRTREAGPLPEIENHHLFPTLRASQGGSSRPFVITPSGVRRITPGEAERIMGFPPGFTDIPWPPKGRRKMRDASTTPGYGRPGENVWKLPTHDGHAPDSSRFSALGNSKPVPILRMLGAALARELVPPPVQIVRRLGNDVAFSEEGHG